MMTIQGNLAGSYPQNNVTPIHPRKMMPTGDTTNAQPTLPDAELIIGNEGDSFTPSGTGSADLNNTPAVADAGDTVAIVKHKKKTHKAKKTSKYKKPEKKKGFAGLPWYGKTAVVVGGTIVATPFLALGAAHIWARMPSKKFVTAEEINKLSSEIVNTADMSPTALVDLLEGVHAKIKMGVAKPPPDRDANMFQQITWGLGQGIGILNNLPQDNRLQLVNYVSWQMWGDMFNKSKGSREVLKNIVGACGVPAKKLFQDIGNIFSKRSDQEVKDMVNEFPVHKFFRMIAEGAIFAGIDMKDRAPTPKFSTIQKEMIETLEKLNASLPENNQYDISSFIDGNPKELGSASVGWVFELPQKQPDGTVKKTIVKYLTANDKQIPEYLNLFYDIHRRETYINYTNELKRYKKHYEPDGLSIAEVKSSSISTLKEVTEIAQILKQKNSSLSEEKATTKAIEMISLKHALKSARTLEQELNTTVETANADAMSAAYEAARHNHSFAESTFDGAKFGNKRLLGLVMAEGVKVNSDEFTALPPEEKLKAWCQFVKLQTIYGATHNDLHGGNMFAKCDGKLFKNFSIFDSGRVGMFSSEGTKALNGLQLMMLAEDPSIIVSKATANTPSLYSTECEAFRKELFNADSGLQTRIINKDEPWFRYHNPLTLSFDASGEIKLGKPKQIWNSAEVEEGYDKWRTTCKYDRGAKVSEAKYKATVFEPNEKTVLRKEAEELIKELETSSEISLEADVKEKATQRAMHYLLDIIEPTLNKEDARYQSAMGQWFDIENF
ncbi:MAG: hypothetical protein H2174_06200 [Vampirovibrio sp.]|nr:hypothetical protein [Vampirovibrio sp.]